MPAKEEARPPPEGASCDPGPSAAPPGSPCRPPSAPLDTRIVMGEETRCPPPEPRGAPPVPCPFPAPPKEPLPARPPSLDPELFFTAPSTPIRAGGARPPPPAPEEPTDGDSEGLCSPPTSPSGSYMTAEGGSWGSSGTASTSPSCSPNLAAEAEGLGEAEGEPDGLGGVLALPPGLGDPPAFPPLSPEEEEEEEDDGPFAPPGCADDEDEDDEDGQTPEEDEDEEEGSGLIPAALLPFRGSLLFQAEAVEISPRAPCREEEEEDEGSTSASFLRSLSESSIPEGGDEAFAFRDDTDASSDSAAYDGDEDERLYGTERHAGDTGTPPGTPPGPPGPAGVELLLRAGSPCHPAGQDIAAGSSLAPPGGDTELDGDTFVTVVGVWPAQEPPEEVTATEGSGTALGQGLCPELAVTDPVPRDPQSHQLGGANGDGPGGDSDGDNDLELSTDGHSQLEPAATGLGTAVTPTPLDEMAVTPVT
ncbi:NACAD protein, partial [Certhia familiaris]|nr:NACAD protein [Certhia familiaris]